MDREEEEEEEVNLEYLGSSHAEPCTAGKRSSSWCTRRFIIWCKAIILLRWWKCIAIHSFFTTFHWWKITIEIGLAAIRPLLHHRVIDSAWCFHHCFFKSQAFSFYSIFKTTKNQSNFRKNDRLFKLLSMMRLKSKRERECPMSKNKSSEKLKIGTQFAGKFDWQLAHA